MRTGPIPPAELTVHPSMQRSADTVCRLELLLAVTLTAAGAWLRCRDLQLETVEHFDEGVYSSVLWFGGMAGQVWPGRDFFAPPGLPLLIELGGLLPGLSRLAPFLPALCCGILTPLAFWLVARDWFGRTAGMVALGITATSDFHILYSRMALTDVPALLLVVLAVWQGSRAIGLGQSKAAVFSGMLTAAAWWLKYTGWLPLAVLYAGVPVWWLSGGHRSQRLLPLLGRLLLITVVTAAGFMPCWLHLQAVGGYSAVAAGHISYLAGLAGWTANLQEQLAGQDRLDGYFGALGLGLAVAMFGILRSLGASGFTWNAGTSASMPQVASAVWRRGQLLQSGRALTAGIFLGVLSLRVGTPFVLLTLAIGGLSGIWLWPTLTLQWGQHRGQVHRGGSGRPVPAGPVYGGGSAAIDPALGFWLTAAWFLGLLLATPFYYPYSRLYLPLAASVWLAAAAGLSWWLEAGLARLELGWLQQIPKRSATAIAARVASLGVLAAAIASTFFEVDQSGNVTALTASQMLRSSLYQDRRSIDEVAIRIADVCVASAGGLNVNPPRTPRGELISPERLLQSAVAVSIPQLTTEQRQQAQALVYAFGEPALLMHLHQAGLLVGPVSHVNSQQLQSAQPTFLILGPNAWRTPGFWDQWTLQEANYDWLGDFEYAPGIVTLMDLYPERFLSEHDDVFVQRFEVYRVRPEAVRASADQ